MKRASQSAPPLPTSRLKVGKPHFTYTYERPYQDDREVRSIWAQIRIDEDWVAAYRLQGQDGRHVVAEAHLIPFSERVPEGGITHRTLGALRTDDVLRALRAFLEDVYDQGGGDHLERHLPNFEIDFLRATDSTTNRYRRSDADLERAGRVYSEAPVGSKRAAVADEMGCSKSAADKWIRRAKDLGYAAGGNAMGTRAP